jgi:hypothetical protein
VTDALFMAADCFLRRTFSTLWADWEDEAVTTAIRPSLSELVRS